MALDFHIADSKETAKKSPPDYQLGQELHEVLFSKLAVAEDSKLFRLHDFDADSVFSSQELSVFHAELVAIMAEFLDRRVFNVLFQLATLAEKAMAKNANIYVFTD